MILPKNYIRFIIIFLLVVICTAFGIEAFFYEDEVYFLLMKSMVQDFDYNLINQISEEKRWLVTKNHFFPSHHSEIQTPLLLIAYSIESIIRFLIPVSVISDGVMSGHLISFASLSIGYTYTNKFLKNIGINFYKDYLLVFLFGSSLFYFSFMTVTAIELMSFALTSYTLHLSFSLKEYSKKNFFLLGISSSLLLISKFYYLSLFILVLYKMFEVRKQLNKEKYIFFILGSALVFVTGLINHYLKYGEFFFWAGLFAESVLLYSWENFFYTIVEGYFGVGGLFYTSPILIPSIIGIFHWGITNLIKRKYVIETIILGAWLGQGLFSPIFLAGVLVEDHYVGRTFFTVLPIYLLGLSYCLNLIKRRGIKVASAGILIIWQMYHMISYLKISREGHYKYTLEKIINFDEFLAFCNDLRIIIATNIGEDILFYFFFSIIISLVLYGILYKFKEKYMESFLITSLILLIVGSILNSVFSKSNSELYFSDSDVYEKTSIGLKPSTYFFIYVLDILNTQELATSNENIKTEINKMRHRYYDKVSSQFIKKSRALDNELKSRKFKNPTFNYYLKREDSL